VERKSYSETSDISLSPVDAFEVREGICLFLFGTSSELPTSKLIVKLFANELPDLKRLGLGDVGDVIDGHALSVLIEERARNSDFVVYTKNADDDIYENKVDDVLNASLKYIDEDVDDVNLSWLTMIRADISDMHTLTNCRRIDITNCENIYGMVS